MALTKSGIAAALNAAFVNVSVPPDVKTALEDYFDRFPTLGAITPAQQATKVENFLSSNVANWKLMDLQRVAVYLQANWENIPA